MGAAESTAQMEKTLFNMRYTSKQLARESKACEKKEAEQKRNVADAIKRNQPHLQDRARIFATNAIREKSQALNYLKLSSRIDAVASRVEGAIRMKTLTKQIMQVTSGMDSILGSMDIAKIDKAMDNFEKNFENLDVVTSHMDSSMASSTASATPEEEIDGLLQAVAQQHSLELKEGMVTAGAGALATSTPASTAADPGRVAVTAATPDLPAAPATDLKGPGKGDGGESSGGTPAATSDLAARLAALRK